ncbi:MAG: hypothetical protein ACE5IF_02960 [Candidatus Bathyarchaeia archaeon]
MGLKDKRSNIKHGKYSRVLVLPASLKIGEESTLAANRLVLVDPRGEINEDDLLQFMENFVEPYFWSWIRNKEVESGS